MDCRMDGRVALITGSSRGLGRAMALNFAASGAHVCVTGRRAEVVAETVKEVEAVSGGKVCGCTADAGKAEDIEKLVKTVEKELGPVDILVNNAGTSRRMPFLEITDELWDLDLGLKFYGAIRAARLTMPGMVERKWGRIINVLNTGAKAPPGGGAPTAVSRAAGMALTKVMAGEGAPHNVLVNGLLVGRIESDQWRNRWEASDKTDSYEEYLDKMAKDMKLPLGRLGTAEEFANMATFLCSDAGSFITGCAINVDGGMSPVM
ncbi:MAG: SDR family oxidoreductase [Alphaproteobacteria bacterium]|nr:SDR family oxidoreductase [Alphaproteobacteria bacterium]